jgi:hypothetical protein
MRDSKSKKKSVMGEARKWAQKHGLFGPQAFLKYAIFRFTENLNQVSDEIVFKGGNLLWVYIATPRATVDLDLATLKTHSHSRMRQLIEKACAIDSDIEFSLHAFREIEQEGKMGAALSLAYQTEQGARNRFEVDLVYALSTDVHEIASPVHPEIMIRSATLENIVSDKILACQRFAAGNTRMKDFDDLWRLSQSGTQIDSFRLKELLKVRGVTPSLKNSWINPEMEKLWKSHRKRYADLPVSLEALFSDVNQWLGELFQSPH